jgi:hypothetical protein
VWPLGGTTFDKGGVSEAVATVVVPRAAREDYQSKGTDENAK